MTNRSTKIIHVAMNILPGLLFCALFVGSGLAPLLDSSKSLASHHRTANPLIPAFLK